MASEISSDWLPPYTIRVERDGKFVCQVRRVPELAEEIIPPTAQLTAEERKLINSYFDRYYPRD